MTPFRFLKMKTIVKNFFLHLTLFILRYVSRSKKSLNSSLPFLDVLVKKHKTGFITSVYGKPTFASQYIHWYSFSLMKRKINLVATLVHRALFICSSSRFQTELDEIRSILVANGYPTHIITSTFSKKIRQFNQLSEHGVKKRAIVKYLVTA